MKDSPCGNQSRKSGSSDNFLRFRSIIPCTISYSLKFFHLRVFDNVIHWRCKRSRERDHFTGLRIIMWMLSFPFRVENQVNKLGELLQVGRFLWKFLRLFVLYFNFHFINFKLFQPCQVVLTHKKLPKNLCRLTLLKLWYFSSNNSLDSILNFINEPFQCSQFSQRENFSVRSKRVLWFNWKCRSFFHRIQCSMSSVRQIPMRNAHRKSRWFDDRPSNQSISCTIKLQTCWFFWIGDYSTWVVRRIHTVNSFLEIISILFLADFHSLIYKMLFFNRNPKIIEEK